MEACVGLAFGVVSGESAIRGNAEIAGTGDAESDAGVVETGNVDPCRINGSCIDVGDTAGALPPRVRDPDPPPFPLFLPLLTPRLAHKNAHINAGKELDCCAVLAAVAEAVLGVEDSD